MDEYTGRKATGRLGFSIRGSNLSFRDPNQKDKSIKYCSRLRCSARIDSMKATQVDNKEKYKYSKASFHSTSSKGIAESSSTSFSSSSVLNRSHQEQQKQISLQETIIAESNNRQRGNKEFRCCNMRTIPPNLDDLEPEFLPDFPTNTIEASGRCNAVSTSSRSKQTNRKLKYGKKDTPGSFVQHSFVSRSTSHVAKPVSQGIGAGAARYGLKNLGCTSISDILSSGCTPSKFNHNRRVDALRKRPIDGETSSTCIRGMNGSSRRYSGTSHSSHFGPPPDFLLSQPNSRRARSQSTNRDGAVSVRTRRPPAGESRLRLSEQGVNIVSPSEAIVIPRLTQAQFSIREPAPERSSRPFTAELPSVFHNTLGRPGTSGQSARTKSSTRPEDSPTQIFSSPSGDRGCRRLFDMEGIAEILMALERIEQDEELTYEQLLLLETNFVLGGLRLPDQHRDMRLDIDNMSYEELLTLEEKMGTVSTGLSEDAIATCLKRNIYSPSSMFPGITFQGNDIKCSICQEEYDAGDEVGKLACQHHFHVTCIDQWLRQKNWCPNCKAPACPS